MSFPGGWHFTHVAVTHCGGIMCVLRDSSGRGLLKFGTWFPPDFTQCAFFFSDFALYSFTVMSHKLNYNCILSSVSPSCELLNWEVILKTFDI